jgi:hypothetical protein
VYEPVAAVGEEVMTESEFMDGSELCTGLLGLSIGRQKEIQSLVLKRPVFDQSRAGLNHNWSRPVF